MTHTEQQRVAEIAGKQRSALPAIPEMLSYRGHDACSCKCCGWPAISEKLQEQAS